MSEVCRRKNSSFTWRSICIVWSSFRKGLGRKIGNGQTSSFWFDNWSELNRPLIDLLPRLEGMVNKDESVEHFVDYVGEWDRAKLSYWFPLHFVDRIMIATPQEERGEDKYFWKPASDGWFSVKNAYQFLLAVLIERRRMCGRFYGDGRFRRKSNLSCCCSHMIGFTRHTSNFAKDFKLQQTALFAAIKQKLLSMHLIRDCVNAKERWKNVVSHHLWDTFFSLQGAAWVK